MLQDRGLLIEGDGGWALTGEADDLPESIQGIIAARLDTLTSEREGVHPGRVGDRKDGMDRRGLHAHRAQRMGGRGAAPLA